MLNRRSFALGLLLLTLGVAAPCAGPDLSGQWQLLKKESDDPEKALKGLGIVRRSLHLYPPDASRNPRDTTEARYFAQQELLKAKRAANASADVGLIGNLLGAELMQITDKGATVEINLDAALRRTLKPAEGGPVYSAKGAEYTRDPLGDSLSWRQDGILQVETILVPRGKMLESYRLDSSAQRLVVDITIDNPDWIIPAKIRRVFGPASAR